MRIAVTHEQARVSSRVAWVSEANDEMYEGSGRKKKKGRKEREEKPVERKNKMRGRRDIQMGVLVIATRIRYFRNLAVPFPSSLPSLLCPGWVFLRHFSQYENIVRVILKPARNVFLF